jgi:hypothetical protein
MVATLTYIRLLPPLPKDLAQQEAPEKVFNLHILAGGGVCEI